MKKTLLAALAVSTFAGCAGLPMKAVETESSPNQTTSQQKVTSMVARAGTALERLFTTPQRPDDDVEAAAASAREEFRREHAKALAGDPEAMFRISQMFRQGTNGAPRDEVSMVSWLRQASHLEHKVASYQLYLHYLNRGLDRQAVHYEKLALRQGYTPPPRLDSRRG